MTIEWVKQQNEYSIPFIGAFVNPTSFYSEIAFNIVKDAIFNLKGFQYNQYL